MAVTKSPEHQVEDSGLIHQPCAFISRQQNEDPIGSAPQHSRYLMLEVPLPWDYAVRDARHFPKGLDNVLEECLANSSPFRFLCFDPGIFPTPEGFRRVMYFERSNDSAAFFNKQEYIVAEDELNEIIESLLMQKELPSHVSNIANTVNPDFAEAVNRLGKAPEDPELKSFACGHDEHYPGTRDLFICTHGRHDLCCGKYGAPMYQHLLDNYVRPLASSTDGTAPPFRVWRTSHFGGHRHAPTMIDLPEGRYWAQLKSEMLDTLLLRTGDFTSIARHYRGWGGTPNFAQPLEREAFKREGWAWIHYKKETVMLEVEETRALVRIDYRSADDTISGRYEAEVRAGEPKEIGGCGSGPSLARQLEVVSFSKTDLPYSK